MEYLTAQANQDIGEVLSIFCTWECLKSMETRYLFAGEFNLWPRGFLLRRS